jgi:hypothetical protein
MRSSSLTIKLGRWALRALAFVFCALVLVALWRRASGDGGPAPRL